MMEKKFSTTLILSLFRAVPLGLRKILFRGLALIFFYVSPKQRLIALHNLSRAFPEKTQAEICDIARRVYYNIGTIAAEFFSMPSLTKENLHEMVEFEGIENYQEALAQGKGVLSIISHFGNWELMATSFPLACDPLRIIYRPLDNPVLENLIGWVRTRNGNTLIDKKGAVRKIIQLLREEQTIGMLVDQNVAAREGVFVNFLGRPACTAVGLAVLALQTGAPVIPGFLVRLENGRYKFIIERMVAIVNTGDYENDLQQNTQNFASKIEEYVRKYPDQWFWLHQRWKTKPWQEIN